MKKLLSKFILNNIKIFLLVLLSLFTGGRSYAQPPSPGGGATNPGDDVPIDMYEGILLIIAVLMIVGVSYYLKNKKQVFK